MGAAFDRRRGERHSVDVPGDLHLSGGRTVAVRVLNVGGKGVLCAVADLEEPIHEGERVLLDHPTFDEEGRPGAGRSRRTGTVVRVDLEFAAGAVTRHLAIFFDGGPPPG